MLKKRVIPTLLLRGNAVVKSVGFKDYRMVGDAMSMVRVFDRRKADEMIILDIEARQRGYLRTDLFRHLAAHCSMPLTLGGGVQSLADADALFSSGADKICINSAAYLQPELLNAVSEKYGSQSLIISVDVRNIEDDYLCYSGSGAKPERVLKEYLSTLSGLSYGELLINSIDCDGLMAGYDLNLIGLVSQLQAGPVIACGGAGKASDFIAAINNGADAVSGGSIFYWEGESILSVKSKMADADINVRLTGLF